MRYASQRDQFRCGPYALLNALKWAGWNYSERRHKKYLCKLVNCRDTGTNRLDMFTGIIKLHNKFEFIEYNRSITINKINRHLRDGGGAIVNIHFYKRDKNKWYGHWVFIEGLGKRGYKVVNYSQRSTISFVKPWTFRREFFNTLKCDDHVSCWLLRRWQ